MPFPLVEALGLRSASRSVITLSSRDRAVQGEKNRVRCERPRCHARFARHHRDEAWPAWRWGCPLSARTRVRERREGLAPDGCQHRRSSPDRDAGAARCPCDACRSTSRAGDPSDACFLHPINPNNEIPPTRRHRSASRDPRRWLARICVRPVCRGRVPSRARTCQEGVPA